MLCQKFYKFEANRVNVVVVPSQSLIFRSLESHFPNSFKRENNSASRSFQIGKNYRGLVLVRGPTVNEQWK
jgi:Tfp pilus assembly pilus retraction ATPase PilT